MCTLYTAIKIRLTSSSAKLVKWLHKQVTAPVGLTGDVVQPSVDHPFMSTV